MHCWPGLRDKRLTPSILTENMFYSEYFKGQFKNMNSRLKLLSKSMHGKAALSVRKQLQCNSYQRDALVRESIITFALLHKFVYEFRGD